MHRFAIVLWLLIAVSPFARADPLNGLFSPFQEVRDRAAAELRGTYAPVPLSRWDALYENVKIGQTKEQMLTGLLPVVPERLGGFGQGQSFSESFRLDGDWVLWCLFRDDDETIIEKNILSHMRDVWVDPPKDFTGKWITYYVNGSKSHEIDYQAGHYQGDFQTFRPDGSKIFVQHYVKSGVIDGDDTGYHPSGKVMYTAHYKRGVPVGVWMWYDESGNVTSTKEHPLR